MIYVIYYHILRSIYSLIARHKKKKCEETSARPKRLMGGVCWEGLEGCASHLEDVCANLGCIVELPVALDDGRRSDCCLDPRARRCTQLGQGLPGA